MFKHCHRHLSNYYCTNSSSKASSLERSPRISRTSLISSLVHVNSSQQAQAQLKLSSHRVFASTKGKSNNNKKHKPKLKRRTKNAQRHRQLLVTVGDGSG
jgi:hypothetical protein